MSDATTIARRLVAEVLHIHPRDLTDSDGIHTIPEWDSLAQLEIVEAIEEQCGLQVTDEQSFEGLASLEGIIKFIEEAERGSIDH